MGFSSWPFLTHIFQATNYLLQVVVNILTDISRKTSKFQVGNLLPQYTTSLAGIGGGPDSTAVSAISNGFLKPDRLTSVS